MGYNMETDLIQRAAAIVGVPEPNSDQLAEWLDEHGLDVDTLHYSEGYVARGQRRRNWYSFHASPQPTLREALAAAVVEVDRIEREAAK